MGNQLLDVLDRFDNQKCLNAKMHSRRAHVPVDPSKGVSVNIEAQLPRRAKVGWPYLCISERDPVACASTPSLSLLDLWLPCQERCEKFPMHRAAHRLSKGGNGKKRWWIEKITYEWVSFHFQRNQNYQRRPTSNACSYRRDRTRDIACLSFTVELMEAAGS